MNQLRIKNYLTSKLIIEIEFFTFRAIQASLVMYSKTNSREYPEDRPGADDSEEEENSLEGTAEQLRLALRLSAQQQMEEEQRRLLEEETFQQVLELSLTDK